MTDRAKDLAVFLLLALSFLAGWTAQSWRTGAVTAKAEMRQAQADVRAEQKTGIQERQHAVDTQKASDEFTQKQPGRDAQLRADLDRAERLRLDAERRAATYRAQAKANAAAGVDLADRLEAYDRHIVEGVEVVARLRGDLARRDDEVVLLSRQLSSERKLQE